jgi:hypothetical protein
VVPYHSSASHYQAHAGHFERKLLLAWGRHSRRSVGTQLQPLSEVQTHSSKKYGKIPLPINKTIAPWEEVPVNLIGPWDVQYNSIKIPGKATIEKIQGLTIIDKATGWPEFIAIRNKTIYHIAILFDSEWLCCYPQPARVVYDNGNEFVGQEFQELLASYRIKAVSTTMRNPRSNGVVDCVHLTMGDM